MLPKKRNSKKEKWRRKKERQNEKLKAKYKREIINKSKVQKGIEISGNIKNTKSKYQHIDDLNLILCEIEKTIRRSEIERNAKIFNYLYMGVGSMFKALDELEDSLNSWQGDF